MSIYLKTCKWSKRDDDFLKENYTQFTVKQLSELLRRSTYGIKKRVLKLDLRKIFSAIEVSPTTQQCCYCKEIKLLTQFTKQNKTKCRKCLFLNRKKRELEDITIYFSHMAMYIKSRAKQHKIPYEFSGELLAELFKKQEGKCFYTGIALEYFGEKRDNTMSVDKIIPEKGYVPGNVVLCTCFVNRIKSNADMEFLKEHMPGWYQKIQTFLESHN